MALLAWNSRYSVGVKALDGQHTVLFNTLNDLHAAMMNGNGKTMTGPLLRKLVEYTRTHFADEEAMLTATKYPGLADHKVRHRELINQVNGYVDSFDRGDAALNLHLITFLSDWLTNHIQKSDHDYSSWLNSHGVK